MEFNRRDDHRLPGSRATEAYCLVREGDSHALGKLLGSVKFPMQIGDAGADLFTEVSHNLRSNSPYFLSHVSWNFNSKAFAYRFVAYSSTRSLM